MDSYDRGSPRFSPEQKAEFEAERDRRTKLFEQQGVIPVGTPIRYMIGREQFNGVIMRQGSELTAFGEPIYTVGEQGRAFGIPRHQSEIEVIKEDAE